MNLVAWKEEVGMGAAAKKVADVLRIANGPLVEGMVKNHPGPAEGERPPTVKELVDAELREVQTFGAVHRAFGGHRWREQFKASDGELVEYLDRTEREFAARLAKLEILTVAHAATAARLKVAENTIRDLGEETVYEYRLREAGLVREDSDG